MLITDQPFEGCSLEIVCTRFCLVGWLVLGQLVSLFEFPFKREIKMFFLNVVKVRDFMVQTCFSRM